MCGRSTMKFGNRKLRVEQLCQRQLLAGDMTNPVNPLDANNDNAVTVGDALVIINYLGQPEAEGEQVRSVYPDTNGDNAVTAGDALRIINHFAEGEHVQQTNGETVIHELEVDAGRSVTIDFKGNNASLTISSSEFGLLTFQAGGQTQTLAIRDSLIINAEGHGNRLMMDGAIVPDDFVVRVKGNDNAVRLVNTWIGDDFIYRGGHGSDGVVLDSGTTVKEVVDIKTRDGDDTVVIRGAQIDDDFLLRTGDGNDLFAAHNSNVGDDAIVRLGDHNDQAFALNVNVRDVADIEGNRGFDTIAADNVIARRLRPDEFEDAGQPVNVQQIVDGLFSQVVA